MATAPRTWFTNFRHNTILYNKGFFALSRLFFKQSGAHLSVILCLTSTPLNEDRLYLLMDGERLAWPRCTVTGI